jgi:hypothetical protein
MLETIREFALERLEESGDANELRSRHAAFVIEFAERAEPELTGPAAASWLSAWTTNTPTFARYSPGFVMRAPPATRFASPVRSSGSGMSEGISPRVGAGSKTPWRATPASPASLARRLFGGRQGSRDSRTISPPRNGSPKRSL